MDFTARLIIVIAATINQRNQPIKLSGEWNAIQVPTLIPTEVNFPRLGHSPYWLGQSKLMFPINRKWPITLLLESPNLPHTLTWTSAYDSMINKNGGHPCCGSFGHSPARKWDVRCSTALIHASKTSLNALLPPPLQSNVLQMKAKLILQKCRLHLAPSTHHIGPSHCHGKTVPNMLAIGLSTTIAGVRSKLGG